MNFPLAATLWEYKQKTYLSVCREQPKIWINRMMRMMTNGKTNIILFSKTWQIVVCARVCATKLWSKECSRTLLNILFSFSSENLVASLPQIIESRKTKELTCLICEPRHVVNERHWCLDFPWPHASTLPIFVTCLKVKAFHNHNSNDKVKKKYNVTLLGSWEGSHSICLRLEVSPSLRCYNSNLTILLRLYLS